MSRDGAAVIFLIRPFFETMFWSDRLLIVDPERFYEVVFFLNSTLLHLHFLASGCWVMPRLVYSEEWLSGESLGCLTT